jgi:NitT/TauT family transport system permease protein
MWKLKGTIPNRHASIISFVGLLFILALWHGITAMEWVPRTILPNPWRIIKSYGELTQMEHKVFGNLWDRLAYSLKLNFLGYGEAVSISLVFGFLIGLFAPIRAFSGNYVDAARYIPMSALTGLLMSWFGIHDNMKIQFLAIGIIVYLLPAVASRVQETLDIHLDTAQTLGATPWQKILTVFFPDTLRRVSTDIINLTAISWTYIIFAELLNNTGGIGSLMWECQRKSKDEQMWAIIILIVAIGFIQDRLFKQLDKLCFRDKYYSAAKR